jgi:hypothetical protein
MIERLRISDFMTARLDLMAARLTFMTSLLMAVTPSPRLSGAHELKPRGLRR